MTRAVNFAQFLLVTLSITECALHKVPSAACVRRRNVRKNVLTQTSRPGVKHKVGTSQRADIAGTMLIQPGRMSFFRRQIQNSILRTIMTMRMK
jgi:hypothetical protein